MTRPWTSSWFTAIQPISFRSAAWVPIGHRTFPAMHQFDARPVIQCQSKNPGTRHARRDTSP